MLQVKVWKIFWQQEQEWCFLHSYMQWNRLIPVLFFSFSLLILNASSCMDHQYNNNSGASPSSWASSENISTLELPLPFHWTQKLLCFEGHFSQAPHIVFIQSFFSSRTNCVWSFGSDLITPLQLVEWWQQILNFEQEPVDDKREEDLKVSGQHLWW